MKALDLFCGAGGAAMGLLAAGFDQVVGIDINPRCAGIYPGEFICADATRPQTWPPDLEARPWDMIWASPPCQRWSIGRLCRASPKGHSDHIPVTRAILASLAARHGAATCIENVPGAPLRADIVLCGVHVGLPRIIRRRHFEIAGFTPPWPMPIEHYSRVPPSERLSISTHGARPYGVLRTQRTGYASHGIAEARAAMGISLPMTWHQLGEAVPPAYARHIASAFLHEHGRTP